MKCLLPFTSAIATSLVVSFASLPANPTIASASSRNQTESSAIRNYLHLVGIRASEITVGARNTDYYFTINLPQSSQSLEKIQIHQRGGMDLVEFQPHRVRAYVRGKVNQQVQIAEVKSEVRNTTITFSPSIEPGQELTLVMGVKENPSYGGNYFFAVQAFLQGNQEFGQSLGVGRVRIDSIF